MCEMPHRKVGHYSLTNYALNDMLLIYLLKGKHNMSIEKYHHLVPKTYLKSWCHNKKTIWYYSKDDCKWDESNIDKICGIDFYHSIMPGSIYTTPNALQEIWSFLSPYHISYNGQPLDTFEKMNALYDFFDEWEILYPNGKPINKKTLNKIKHTLSQAKHNNIEKQWSVQFENDWNDLVAKLEKYVADYKNGVVKTLDSVILSELMRYSIMFEWRGSVGDESLNIELQRLDEMVELSTIDIPECDRVHPEDKTAFDAIKHEYRLKAFDDFQQDKGIMYMKKCFYEKNFSFTILQTSGNDFFITSDNPCFNIIHTNNTIEPFLVINPQLALTLTKIDNLAPSTPVITIDSKEVNKYNQEIYQSSQAIIMSLQSFDITKILH